MAGSPNFGLRRGGARPELVVVHYTAMASCAAARARLCDPEAEVSAHWLISEAGVAEALVSEEMRAWHAGAGSWGGIGDVNSRSIGIELANPGDRPFPEPQMAALETLLAQIMGRWGLGPEAVIAHSDLAPERKGDPGARFDWQRLARRGLSVWPRLATGGGQADQGAAPQDRDNPISDMAEQETRFLALAEAFGYPVDAGGGPVLQAFRLRFRPEVLRFAVAPALERRDVALMADLAGRFGADGGAWRAV